ncbi:polysaccharide deacetylase family protein [Pseudonocardia dioxanivorans]|uniref:polysaccharide deacetylase family protein n=1 Tax=Pseudonocardia dioxanivorans TaxID=240495 RepID=UPI000CD20269|nr:polysaccharide deacetylase family protein [Pseudonocardia dioxanivorans]
MTGPGGRDVVGYGPTPPTRRWLGDDRLAISLVVNYEEGSERSLPAGDATQESLTEWGAYPFPDGVRNLAMESMYEYGSRVGVWRILDVLRRHGVPATFFACAQAFEMAPAVAEAVSAAGHEVCSHGWRWEEVFGLSEEEEREHIRMAVESLERTTGSRPVGWYCRYGPSERTRRLVVEEGGFLYDSDSYADDVPYEVDVDGTSHLVVPYTADTNDIQFWLADPLATSEQFFTYLKDAFDTLYRESAQAPRMMSVGLHCRIIGRPARIAGLERFVEYASGFDGVVFTTRERIARSWRASADGPVPASPVTVIPRAEATAGAGEGSWATMLVDADTVPHATSTLGLSHVLPGESTALIRHTTEEVCLVVAGSGVLRTDLGDVAFTTGDTLHIPAGRPHAIVNTGDVPAEMVFSFPGARRPRTEEVTG